MNAVQDPKNTRKPAAAGQNIIPARKLITETYLSNAGAYYLQRFSASRRQFRKVMLRKIDRSCKDHPGQDRAVCIAMLDHLILRFTDLGYLDDDRFAVQAVSALRARGLSRLMILARLQDKGLDPALIQTALQRHQDTAETSADDDEMNAALKLARKRKLGPYARKDRPRPDDDKRAMGILARAGFSYEICARVLKYDLNEDQTG